MLREEICEFQYFLWFKNIQPNDFSIFTEWERAVKFSGQNLNHGWLPAVYKTEQQEDNTRLFIWLKYQLSWTGCLLHEDFPVLVGEGYRLHIFRTVLNAIHINNSRICVCLTHLQCIARITCLPVGQNSELNPTWGFGLRSKLILQCNTRRAALLEEMWFG